MSGKFIILNILAMIPTVSLTSLSTTWKHESLQCQGTYSEYCFNGPDSADDYQTFDDAMFWCRNKSSQLAVINDSETQDEVSRFLDSFSGSSTNLVYINMKLLIATHLTWYLVNGSVFYGGVVDQNSTLYNLYNSLQFASTPPPGSWGFGSRSEDWWSFASRPDVSRQYICEFNGSDCSIMNNSFQYNGSCYVKYDNDSLNWFEARKRCVSDGGDLAKFNLSSTETFQPPFDTSMLNRSLSYWVGIRYSNLSWMSPADAQNESMFYNFSSGKPNNFNNFCVCLDPTATPRWSWTDCDCQVKRPFPCLTKIQTTPKATTTTATTTTQSTMSANVTAIGLPIALIVGVVVGVGGGIIIIIIVVIIVVVCISSRRKKRRARISGNEEKPNEKLARTGEYLDAEAIQGFAADNPQKVPDVAHPKKENGTATQEGAGLYAEVFPGSGYNKDSLKGAGHEETTYDDLEIYDKNKDKTYIVKNRTQTIYLPEEPASDSFYANYAG